MKKFFVLFILIGIQPFVYSQKQPFTIETLYAVKYVGAPAVSPDGEKVAFNVTEYKLEAGKSNSDIYIMDSDGSNLSNITSTAESEYHPFWKSSSELLYLRGGQVYIYNLDSGEEEQLTDFGPGISNPVISPDGNLIAFTAELFPECGLDEACNDSLDYSQENGPIQAYVADNLLFRHWTEYSRGHVPYLLIYNISEKTYKIVSASEWLSDTFMLGGGVKYSFSPDSKEICFEKNPDKNLASSTNTDLWIVPAEGGKPENITSENKSFDGYPVYSKDGKYIAYKLQLEPAYEADKYRIAVYNRETKSTEILTEEFENTIDDFFWSENSQSIYFIAPYQGYSPVYNVDISDKKIEMTTDKESVFGMDINTKENALYLNLRRVDKPSEIYKFNLADKEKEQLTFFNKELLEEVDFRPAEQMWVEGADGIKVHVFIVKPHNFDPDKKYPLILNVHGGPQGQWMDSFRGDWQVYPGAGYVVAFPNPHGSTGYGQDYTAEISGDWGGKVYEDVMKVTDALEKLPYVDKDRIGAMGWSYGGYMMNWLQAKTDRYKCLVSMMGIFDLRSMWGATEELWFVNWDLKGQPWNSDNYDKYSPSSFIENFSTPTLIITGEKDYRVPYTQSLQYFTTLQTLGIDSRLIIFPNDGHWPSFVKSMPVYYDAHLDWFHKYLGGEPAPYNIDKLIKNVEFNEWR